MSATVLFTGGKGGVGKTSVCALLARTLCAPRTTRLGDRPRLGTGQPASGLGLCADAGLDRLLERRRESSVTCVTPGPDGLDLIAAGSGDPRLAHLGVERCESLLNGLDQLAPAYELVLADGAAGIGPDLLDFAARVARVIVVTDARVVCLDRRVRNDQGPRPLGS